MPALTLYTYYRSSCAYRVRIALALKGLDFEPRYIHLLHHGGENWRPNYRQLNPLGLVPTLVDGQQVITQSLAIIDYLDEVCPEPPLYPANPWERARVQALALTIACDIQPLCNLRVLDHLKQEGIVSSEQQTQAWNRHWISEGLAAVETLLGNHRQTQSFCHGDRPTLADICLIPQVYNAKRFHCDLSAFPSVLRIYDSCTALPAFRLAAPENQSDAQ